MTDRPSLEQLRSGVFKHSGTGRPEVGNWLARRVGRPSAVYGTWAAARVGLSAHSLTLAALIASLSGAILIATGLRMGFVTGVGLLVVAYWLDHVDGQVARWRGTVSLSGVYFDYLMHHATSASLGFALGFGISLREGSPLWSVAGFVVGLGWTGLSLHNDCRYKAFFQRLKASQTRYIVRPSPTTDTRSDHPSIEVLRVDPSHGAGKRGPLSPWERKSAQPTGEGASSDPTSSVAPSHSSAASRHLLPGGEGNPARQIDFNGLNPRPPIRTVSWSAAKICEPHVVLLELMGLALIAIAAPTLWSAVLRYAVASMAILAPTLAIARIAKAIRTGTVDSEFDAWFHPAPTPTSSPKLG